MEQKKEVDLNLISAFEEEPTKPAEVSEETKQDGTEAKEEVENNKETETKTTGESDDNQQESKVPYSRFKKFHELYKESEQEKARLQSEYEAKLAELESSRSQRQIENSDEMPKWWKDLYGDSEQSESGWKIWSANNPRLSEETIIEKAKQAIKQEQQQEEESFNKNISTIDEALDDVSVIAGRDLTESEQDKILDIIDEYSPKNEEGKYMALISPEKAWRIYDMENKVSTASKKSSRDNVASIINSQSEGDTSIDSEKDKNFNPSWGALDSAIKKYL